MEFGKNQDRIVSVCKKKGRKVCIATDLLISLYSCLVPTRGDLMDIYYIKSKYQCEEVVCSAGIACSDLVERFAYLLNNIAAADL